jgi:hypothetical protein
MKTHRDFIRTMGLVFDPSSRVIEQLAKLDRNKPEIDSDVSLARAEAPRPPPDVCQHAADADP